MKRAWLFLLPALLLAPMGWAFDEPSTKPKSEAKGTPAEQVAALTKEYQDAMQALSQAYQAAKTESERKAILEKLPDRAAFAARFLEIADKHLGDPAALDALLWIASFSPTGAEGQKAFERLAKDHLKSPKLANVIQRLAIMGNPDAEPLLAAAREKGGTPQIKGAATYGLAQAYKAKSEQAPPAEAEKASKEAEKLYQEIIDHYGDLKLFNRSLSEMAKRDLFEIQHLGIGKEAPEIEGDDIDGKPFKLTQYRGKVVVLDFWGNW